MYPNHIVKEGSLGTKNLFNTIPQVEHENKKMS